MFKIGDRVKGRFFDLNRKDYNGIMVGTIKEIQRYSYGNVYVVENRYMKRNFFESELTKLEDKKEDKTMTDNNRANIEIQLPEGLKGIDISILAKNKDVLAKIVAEYEDEQTKKIDDSGYIQELESRWIPAEFFELVYGGRYSWNTYADNLYRKHGYMYQFTFFLGKGSNKGELRRMIRDRKRAKCNGRFFTKELLVIICETTVRNVDRYVRHCVPVRGKFKGKEYIRLGANRGSRKLDVIVDPYHNQIDELIIAPLKREIELLKRCGDEDYYEIRKHFARFYQILTNECFIKDLRYPYCKEFIDAFKGNGAYHAIRDLIRDPKKKCVIRLEPNIYKYNMDLADKLYGEHTETVVLNSRESLNYVETKTNDLELGEFYKLLGLYKDMVSYNKFDMKEHLKEYRHETEK